MKRITRISSILTLMSILGSPAYATCLDDIRKAGIMLVGNGLLGAHPSLWQDSEGTYHGIDADILSELTRRMKLPKSEFMITEWSTMVPGLKAGRWDIVLSDVNITQERQVMSHVLFSTPYFMLYDYLIVPENSPIHALSDMKGKIIGSVLGTNDSATAHRLVEQGIGSDVADYDTFGDPFVALHNGQVDAVVVDQGTLHAQSTHFKGLRTVGGPIFYTPKPAWIKAESAAPYRLGSEGIVVREACPDLLQAINGALNTMRSDGTIRMILKKYGVWEPQQDHLIKTPERG
ncbi:substrate-binding periplasmic protein [Gluconobacter wancherniae]|uniref:substrate-binding periplasmic protein n=1 Tax=Gluconobacter wancherniae TaxID=1307955 RepID=UPI001B8C866C|nr:transporter substrate-binding domain-containing protein [Gluconobacter wancherniae]MBS1093971.1 amino acid ABC transporter substrate-binding protein [Gluconobacter wancherniae]